MAEKSEKRKEEEKRKKRVRKGYNIEPAEEPVQGPTGKKEFEV